MQTSFPRSYFVFAIVILCTLNIAVAKDYQLYLFAGQSNMEGYGHNSKLPDKLKRPQESVMIFCGNSAADGDAKAGGMGIWAKLEPGYGGGFSTDGKTNKLSDRFGSEIGFAARLREKNPKANVAIVKYSRGGTSIDVASRGPFGCWDPDYNLGEGAGRGINQYDHCLTTIRNALAVRDIDGDGEDDRLIPAGIVWMQGESDAYHLEAGAKAYRENLETLMNLLSAALRYDDLPTAIGRISDSGQDDKDGKIWNYGEIVREAQASFANDHTHVKLITTTDNYGYSDPYHYDTEGFLDLGRQFADALMELHGAGKQVAEGAPKQSKE